MIKMVVHTDDFYTDSDKPPINDPRVAQEVVAKGGQSELKEWVLTVETWDEFMQFVLEHGGAASIEVPEQEGALGAFALTGE